MSSNQDNGNAAELREALKRIVAASIVAKNANAPEWILQRMADIFAMATTALAAPPRNCDRPECATVQGADEEFCKAGERDHSLGMCWEDLCYWLLAPAAEKEGGAE